MAYQEITDTQTQISGSGHIKQECDHVDDAYMIIKHKEGHHIFLDADGSVQILSLIHI